jgi:Flp pilus assembly protein TadB
MLTLKDTSVGKMMLAVAAGGVICGYFVMMKIAKVDF